MEVARRRARRPAPDMLLAEVQRPTDGADQEGRRLVALNRGAQGSSLRSEQAQVAADVHVKRRRVGRGRANVCQEGVQDFGRLLFGL